MLILNYMFDLDFFKKDCTNIHRAIDIILLKLIKSLSTWPRPRLTLKKLRCVREYSWYENFVTELIKIAAVHEIYEVCFPIQNCDPVPLAAERQNNMLFLAKPVYYRSSSLWKSFIERCLFYDRSGAVHLETPTQQSLMVIVLRLSPHEPSSILVRSAGRTCNGFFSDDLRFEFDAHEYMSRYKNWCFVILRRSSAKARLTVTERGFFLGQIRTNVP